jgi:hypothetical protein
MSMMPTTAARRIFRGQLPRKPQLVEKLPVACF